MAESEETKTKPSNMQPAGPIGDGPDTDGDGMSDEYETKIWNSDPTKKDTDGDGLSDAAEWWLDTKPRDKDTDGDGWEDGNDLAWGDPLRHNPGGQERAEFLKRARDIFDAEGSDKDGDYVRDHIEEQEGLKKDNPDSDNDGLSDLVEIQLRGKGVDVDPAGSTDTSDLDKARLKLEERREPADTLKTDDTSALDPVDDGQVVAVADPVPMIETPIESEFGSPSAEGTAVEPAPVEEPMAPVSDAEVMS
jgi:hypothetical protein